MLGLRWFAPLLTAVAISLGSGAQAAIVWIDQFDPFDNSLQLFDHRDITGKCLGQSCTDYAIGLERNSSGTSINLSTTGQGPDPGGYFRLTYTASAPIDFSNYDTLVLPFTQMTLSYIQVSLSGPQGLGSFASFGWVRGNLDLTPMIAAERPTDVTTLTIQMYTYAPGTITLAGIGVNRITPGPSGAGAPGAEVPLPASLPLAAGALALLAWMGRRRHC